MEGSCPICNKKAVLKCAKCYSVFYCSKEHQKDDWKIHKSQCKPVIIKEDRKLGRHLVASKDIKDSHIVFKEKPLIVGPAQVTPPVCLGCLKTVTAEDSRPCERCGWPVCNETCQSSPHHKPECDLTVAKGNKVHINTFGLPHPNYQCLTVLRCLYQKKNCPEIWKKLMALESHCQQRKGTVKWNNDKLQVAEFIRRFFKLENEFTLEEIMKVSGIVQVNGHEVPLTDSPFVAIYDTTSMLEHNCRANCNKSFTSRGEILIVAAKDIFAGDNISICYTDPLWGTFNRRHHLEETKFFRCVCERCSDVTELGTMFSALRCQREHCLGFVLPKSFIEENYNSAVETEANGISNQKVSTTSQNGHTNGHKENGVHKLNSNINDEDSKLSLEDFQKPARNEEWSSKWNCNKCDFTMNEHSVLKLIEHIGRDLDAMEKGDCDSCLRFLHHYGKYLHHNHYYMFDVSMAMANLIGQEEGGLTAISDQRLEMKINTCKKLINILEKLVPAEVRARGTLLFELHAGVAETGRRRTERTGEGPSLFIDHLLQSREILKKSVHLLQHEPEELPEGKMVKQAQKNFEDMEAMLINLRALELPSPL